MSRSRAASASKPHYAEFACLQGGVVVYVCARHPNGVSAVEYQRILSRGQGAQHWGWRTMRRNPSVFVRGRITHADHKTIVLHCWHQVLMNTENQSQAMRNVAFLD